MAGRVVIKLHGEHITLATLAEAMLKTSSLLSELDQTVSGRRTLDWDIGELKRGSAEVGAIPRLLDPDSPDFSDRIISAFYKGIAALDDGAERPDSYTDRALSIAKDLGSMLISGVQKITFTVAQASGNLSEPLNLTQRVSANVDEILGQPRISFGSIDGHLGRLDEWGNAFFIQDRITGKKIRCECDTSMLDEVATKYWKKNVVVTGLIEEDRRGKPKAIKAKRFRPLREQHELPQPEDLLGLYVRGNDGE